MGRVKCLLLKQIPWARQTIVTDSFDLIHEDSFCLWNKIEPRSASYLYRLFKT